MPSTLTAASPGQQGAIPFSTYNGKRTPLSSILPPLIFGTATFNHQYNNDPFQLDTKQLVASALTHGIRAYDTSPYYGPSEQLLGDALATPSIRQTFPRNTYMLSTKVGRIASEEFNYSAEWVQHSVRRSLQRLQTDYLDLVFCHDVEFVSVIEVLEAVRELDRIREQEGAIRYIGISGYPLHVLGDIAELVLKETGKPLDVVQSYAHFTLQNQALAGPLGVQRLRGAGVDVVLNASVLGMGLLRRQGVPVGGLGDWHPAPSSLRDAVRKASDFCNAYGERIEDVAVRFALKEWITAGSICGSQGDTASGLRRNHDQVDGPKFGVSVIGVSHAPELDQIMLVWRSLLDGMEDGAGRWHRARELSQVRAKAVQILAEGVQEMLGDAFGLSWNSPEEGFVNKPGSRRIEGGEESKAK